MASSRSDARFSTYSGAPSLQPSLAPTFDTQQSSSARTSQQTYLSPATGGMSAADEKSGLRTSPYGPGADPAFTTSSSTLASNDPKSQDLKSWSGALERMQDERLDKQRYVMSGNKSEEVSKLALGAKVERALARRMVGQDAQFKPKAAAAPTKTLDSEKRGWEVEAN